jgi:hypothetical protein
MKQELKASRLCLEQRAVISKSSVFNWLSFFKPLKKLFVLLDAIFHFQGYLTVLIVRKCKRIE